jgi:chitinase
MIRQHSSRFAVIGVVTVLALTLVLGVAPAAAARDRTPPTAPVLSVTDVGATHVSLAWTASTDNQPYIWYRVYLNGNPYAWAGSAGAATSVTLTGLTPATQYTFTVLARDNGINWSPPSNAVTVSTQPVNNADTTPPTVPGNLAGFDQGCGEASLSWNQSTDNLTSQTVIRYEIFVNGVFRPESTVHGRGSTIAYAVVEGSNTFEVFAIDSAGNRSAPASVTLQMFGLCQ